MGRELPLLFIWFHCCFLRKGVALLLHDCIDFYVWPENFFFLVGLLFEIVLSCGWRGLAVMRLYKRGGMMEYVCSVSFGVVSLRPMIP